MLAGRLAGWLLAIRLSLAQALSLRESTALSKTLRLGSGPRREERRRAAAQVPLGGGRAACNLPEGSSGTSGPIVVLR